MILLNNNYDDNSDEEKMDDSEEMDGEPSEEDEEEDADDNGEDEEADAEMAVKKKDVALKSDNDEDDDDDEEEEVDAGHPYPTPPPDAAAAPSKKTKPVGVAGAKTTSLVKGGLAGQAMAAIMALNERTGSSVKAIIKYMKFNGIDIPDERRTSKFLMKTLKLAESKGQLVRLKNSFKLTAEARSTYKAMEKLKKKNSAKAEKVKVKELAKAEKLKMKEANKKTEEPPKKRVAAVGGKAKGDLAAEALAAKETKATKAKRNAKAKQMTESETTKEEAPKNSKSKASSKASSKAPRKSIGTLAKQGQPKSKSKLKVKSIKQLVTAKSAMDDNDDIDSDINPSTASTPVAALKAKRKVKLAK